MAITCLTKQKKNLSLIGDILEISSIFAVRKCKKVRLWKQRRQKSKLLNS